MHECEAVRGRADRRQVVQFGGEQIRGALESTHDRRARGGDGGPLVRAATAHIHARAVLRAVTMREAAAATAES